jgi:hypothetical protein
MTNGKTYTSVIAVGKAGNRYRAAEVHRTMDRFEVSRYFSCEADGKSLAQVAADLAAAGWGKQHSSDSTPTPVVAVFEGGMVVFRRIDVPSRSEKELESIVRMQAESILPLSPDEIEIGWRDSQAENGRVGVTIAAARTVGLRGFAEEATALGPVKIVLECDGFVRAWSEACRVSAARAIVVRPKAESTDVCVVEGGLLSQATRIDMGVDEMLAGGAISVSAVERLKQDIEGAAEMFGSAKGTPIYVAGDGSAGLAQIAKYLADSGLPVQASVPKAWSARDGAAVPPAELYQYMAEAGAAMLAIEGTKELNVFSRLYRPREEAEKAVTAIPLKKAAVIAVAALLAALVLWYGLDKWTLWRSEKLLNEQRDGSSVVTMLQQHKAISETASERPDILDILTIAKAAAPADVLFHNFIFRKGKPVSLTGQARSNDSLYTFEDALRKQKGIANVKEQSAVKDDKENKVVFTVTFDYRTFTKGQAEPLAGFGR